MSLFFLFVQFEFTHSLGPHAGRYVVEPKLLHDAATSNGQSAAEQPSRTGLDKRNRRSAGVGRGVGGSDVFVINIVGAPTSKHKVLRRARKLETDEKPAEVPLLMATYVKGTEPMEKKDEANKRLESIRFSEEEQEQWMSEGLHVLNLAIRGHRAGAPDPYAVEVTRRDARRIRLGFGDTEDVQSGSWREAFELPPATYSKPKRMERLRPSEAVAAALGGKSEVLEAEDLLMRGLIDLDQRRTRGAAHQVAAAMKLLPSELGSRPGTEGLDFNGLTRRGERAQELATVGADGPLNGEQVEELEAIIDHVTGQLDTWRYRHLDIDKQAAAAEASE